MSSWCEGIYRCRMRIGIKGVLLILIICRYGDISGLVGIFVMLFGWVYLLLIIVSNPPRRGTYGIPICLLCHVLVGVLLNRSLYCENIFCTYLGDFWEVSLVSYKVIMARVYLIMKDCKHGNELFKEEIFHVVKWVA
jgi:hypothetical protein